MIPWFVGSVVRYEGRKFLSFTGDVDLSRIAAEVDARRPRLTLHSHTFLPHALPLLLLQPLPFKEDQARSYFADLRSEVDMYAALALSSMISISAAAHHRTDDELAGFVTYLKSKFEVQRISLETTPRELTPESIAQLQELGVKRLSVACRASMTPCSRPWAGRSSRARTP